MTVNTLKTPLSWAILLATLGVSAQSSAYYVEQRQIIDREGMPQETVFVTYADGDESSPGTTDVTYRINPGSYPGDVSGVDEAVAAAFATYNDVGCSTFFASRGEDTPLDGNNITDKAHWMRADDGIYIAVFFTEATAEWTTGPHAGHFYWGFNRETGRMIGGSLILNSKDHAWTTTGEEGRLDVQSVLTGLLGRALGLASNQEGAATRLLFQTGNTDLRMLNMDEIDGMTFLYTADGEGCDMEPGPEGICDGGIMECPPRLMVDAGPGTRDASVVDSGVRDSGTGSTDSGTTTGDAGTGPDDGEGCGCHVRNAKTNLGWLAIAMGMLFVRRRRQR